MSQERTIGNNMCQIASGAYGYFIEAGATQVDVGELFGTDLYIKAVPSSVAGEDYTSLFPIRNGVTSMAISTGDGRVVRVRSGRSLKSWERWE